MNPSFLSTTTPMHRWPLLLPAISRSIIISSSTKVNPFDLKPYALQKTNSINKALEAAVPLREPVELHEAMRYTLLAGRKRIVPIWCIACCELVGGSESIALPTACAHEMILTTWLMFDDLPCMDNSDLRRGKPSNHLVYGEHLTVMAGTSLVASAFEYIASASGPPVIASTRNDVVSSESIARVIREIARSVGSEGVAAGQAVDIMSTGGSIIGLDRLEYIHRHKTAIFIESAAVCGAILGGASDEDIEKLRELSRCFGLVCQVVDDILDVTKTSQELGKNAGQDVEDGKMTYPRLIGLHESVKLANRLTEEAKEMLVGGFDPEKAAPLLAMADYVVDMIK